MDDRPARVALGRARRAHHAQRPRDPEALSGVDPARAGRDVLPYLPNTGDVVNRGDDELVRRPRADARLGEARLPGRSSRTRPTTGSGRRSRTSAGSTSPTPPRPGGSARDGSRASRRASPSDASTRSGSTAPAPTSPSASFPSSAWHAADFTTVDGLRHFPNIPSEEMFTTPDPLRADGHVTATRPLEVYGAMIDGIRVEFEAGRAVKIDADRGRGRAARDRGEGRRRVPARGARARRRRGPHRPARHDVLRDAARRERREPHRARQRLRQRRRGDRGQGARQPELDPRRLHDRLARARRRRPHRRRRRRAAPPRRRLAGVTPGRSPGPVRVAAPAGRFPSPAVVPLVDDRRERRDHRHLGHPRGLRRRGRVALGARHRRERSDDRRRPRPRRRDLGGGRRRARGASSSWRRRSARSSPPTPPGRSTSSRRTTSAKGCRPTLAQEVAEQLTAHDALAAQLETEHGIDAVMSPTQPVVEGVSAGIAFALGAAVPARDHPHRLDGCRVLGDPRRSGRLPDPDLARRLRRRRSLGPADARPDARRRYRHARGQLPRRPRPLLIVYTGGSGSYWM